MLSFIAVSVAVLLLPESIVQASELLYQFRASLRRALAWIAENTVGGPFFKLLQKCLKKLFGINGQDSRGISLSLTWDAPHSLRAEALSGDELMVWWTARPGQEHFICAWHLVADAPRWHESIVTENGCRAKGLRWTTVLKLHSLSSESSEGNALRVRIRVCAAHQGGRSSWSEEKELELVANTQEEQSSACNGSLPKAATITDAAAASAGTTALQELERHWLCCQCRAPQPKCFLASYADVLYRPLFAEGCTHGPYCRRCCRAISDQVLPTCVCRALIGSWREEVPSDAVLEKSRCTQNEASAKWDEREVMIWVQVTMRTASSFRNEDEANLYVLQRWKSARCHLTEDMRDAIRSILESKCGIRFS